MRDDNLRRGEVVEVRSAAEILATLDQRGMLAGLPFMPEMLPYCGRRFVVDKRADKICDTIHYSGSRELPDAVLLEDLRCDGSGHDGCQAECRLFWKEAWLRRVGPGEPPVEGAADEAHAALAHLVDESSKQSTAIGGQSVASYRCQATELYRASRRLRTWDPRPYLREYTSGNVGLGRFLRITARALLQESAQLPRMAAGAALRRLIRKPSFAHGLPRPPTRRASARVPALDLQPGDLVRVKSRKEIAATLTPQGKNRGLWFDREMAPYCGGTYRVRQRLERFIDDRSGQMIELKTDCLTLDGVVCSGERSPSRWFCPRAIYPYWREIWLRRIETEPRERSSG